MNPRVPVHIDKASVTKKSDNFFQQFDLVLATDLDLDSLLYINSATRRAQRPFYAASSYGLYGFIFADLLTHEFVVKRIKSNRPTENGIETRSRRVTGSRETKEGDTLWEFVTKEEAYVPLETALSSKIDKTWRARKRKNVPAVLPGVIALLKFQRQQKHWPVLETKEDMMEFTKVIGEVTEGLELPKDGVDAHFIR